MSKLRAVLPLALLVSGCGDSGGDSGTAGTATNTSVTGVTAGSASTAPSTTPTASDSDASGDDTSAGSQTMTGDTSPTTGPSTQTGPISGTDDPGTTDPSDTTTGDPETSTTAVSVSDTGGETTYASFGDTTTSDECKQQIDIVFSMDVSTSMLGILQKLENEILAVDDKLKTLPVVPDVNYGLVVFVDDSKIINGGAPYADVQTLKADFNYWWNFTQSNSQVNGGGSNGDWPENSIDSLYLAAFAFQWRPVEDTLRMVIHCTDDTFGDKGAVQSGEVIQHSYAETVLGLQERQVRVFVFADNDKTGGPGNNEDVSAGFFTPYNGQTAIPEATDGGAFNINLVNANQLSLGAAINDSVEQNLCVPYIPM